jgi:pentapeptide MXKDX repeat protein
MKYVMCCGFVSVVVALSAVASAQGREMNDKMDKMPTLTSYTGCIERSPGGAFTLGHATASDAMVKKSMAKDSMSKDSMAKDSMAHDSMMKDAMAPELGLSSTSVDLTKHVGHKVTVKGVSGDTMGAKTTFTVKSIKMVASSCS